MSSAAAIHASSDDARERDPFAAFLLDDETTQNLAPVAMDRGWDTGRIQGGGIANAVRSLALASPPSMLIVDISNSEEPRSDITALAEVCEPGTIVIALGTVNDVALYRDLIATGVYDYLVKPVTSDQLRQAIATAEELSHATVGGEPSPVESGGLITVIGSRGGVGASTIAVNSAWVMANELKRKTALLDLDIHFGTAALCFDLEPGRGLYDALENPGRVDGLFIERAMVKAGENFWILSGEAPLSDAMAPNPTALDHLLAELKVNFKDVILDLPRSQIAHQQFVLSESKCIVIVCDLSLTSIRDTIRLLAFVKEMAPNVAVRIVANKVNGGGRDEVSQKDFENAIEAEVDLVIPNDPKTAAAASKTGKTLPESGANSKAAIILRQLALDLADGEKPAKKQSFWKRSKTGD